MQAPKRLYTLKTGQACLLLWVSNDLLTTKNASEVSKRMLRHVISLHHITLRYTTVHHILTYMNWLLDRKNCKDFPVQHPGLTLFQGPKNNSSNRPPSPNAKALPSTVIRPERIVVASCLASVLCGSFRHTWPDVFDRSFVGNTDTKKWFKMVWWVILEQPFLMSTNDFLGATIYTYIYIILALEASQLSQQISYFTKPLLSRHLQCHVRDKKKTHKKSYKRYEVQVVLSSFWYKTVAGLIPPYTNKAQGNLLIHRISPPSHSPNGLFLLIWQRGFGLKHGLTSMPNKLTSVLQAYVQA